MTRSTTQSRKPAPTQPGPDGATPARRTGTEAADEVVASARTAAEAFRALDQEQVDAVVAAMVRAGLTHAVELARLAVEECGFGIFEDKVVKNFLATEFLYDYLRDKRTVGVIDEDPALGIQHVAEPIGVILAITPITNPTSTVLFKAICAAKTRNAIVFRPHPLATRSAARVVELLREAGEAAGMPAGALAMIPDVEHSVTHHLFRHPGVDFIWTTGGTKIVELTNSAGKPAMSVGPGNAPCYIHRSADLEGVVVDVLISKTFDASVICPAEQTLVIDDVVHDRVVGEFCRLGAHLLTAQEQATLTEFAFGRPGDEGRVNLAALGQTAPQLAERAGITVPGHTKVLLATLPADPAELAAHPLCREKLMPVLGVVRATSEQNAIDCAVTVTEHGGLGHTSSIYAHDDAIVERYAAAVRTGRILVNAPTAVGALGGIYNSLPPTFSLGCGTWGGSSTTDNVNYRNLLNIKTVSRRKTPPQWFRVPSNIFFNVGALENLRTLKAERVLLVTDTFLEESGTVRTVRDQLTAGYVKIYSAIRPEPDEAAVMAGVAIMRELQPDLLVAVGGGSVIDAAKAMRLFYEHPELDLAELSLPFLDPRKRVADFPTDSHSLRFVAVPTTAGTGSEVSPAAVITVGRRKATMVDYCLVPDMAIVDPMLTLSLPPGPTADTGLDALTHALEGAVSIFSSPYTDAFCMQAIRMIFQWLPAAVEHGDDIEARTGMANASTMAGLAFSNAFLGVNHAMAHAIGAQLHVPHGRANAVLLPHVLRYNASLPTKFMPAPGYSTYVAPEKYAQIGYILFGGRADDERRERLFTAVDELIAQVHLPRTLRDAGVAEQDFLGSLPDLVSAAFTDMCTRTNPRMPMVAEIEDLLRKAYYG
ncbi:bifunctional acetaldehyde-CoA/alcohol dehydrogenase [Kineosporia sp. A_224]|uniref:bifunctional acetaldehyde-CoA/alcohol dehydrogenase n=1 Tax=Kineosporia sp. A_224 TaxID=1962180 RepID=UPI000B4A7B32|nr:bifunctional acetaldehyde-CoA/alcohol dehydrogenase [Kineosporia sp. A_224]